MQIAVDGKTAVLSFDIARQDLIYQGDPYSDQSDAVFGFRIDGVAGDDRRRVPISRSPMT